MRFSFAGIRPPNNSRLHTFRGDSVNSRSSAVSAERGRR